MQPSMFTLNTRCPGWLVPPYWSAMYRCTSTELPGVAGNEKVIAGLSVFDHRSVSKSEMGV